MTEFSSKMGRATTARSTTSTMSQSEMLALSTIGSESASGKRENASRFLYTDMSFLQKQYVMVSTLRFANS